MSSGHGVMSNDKKEVRWIMDYQPLLVIDRNLTFNILSNSNDISSGEEGSISFKVNMDKAIKRTVYSKINKTIESQGIKYKFTTLSASQMSVLINGTIQANFENGKELFGGPIDETRRNLKVQLLESYIVNGKAITGIIDEQSFGLVQIFSAVNFIIVLMA